MKYLNVGIYGSGVMGVALARNLARNDYKVCLSNRSIEVTKKAQKDISTFKESVNIFFADTLEELTKKVSGPIILLIPSGDPQQDLITGVNTSPIDDVIFNGSESIGINSKVTRIKPLCEIISKRHIIIDAGNSHPYATSHRDLKLSKYGISFLGMGVSGGEMGALKGPSIMVGGSHKTYKRVEEMLKRVAAKKGKTSCCGYMGPAGAGHFVKVVHNGIEYAIMEVIAEAYWILKKGLGLTNVQIRKFFDDCNKGIFRSYLFDITTHILNEKDPVSGVYILDEILDSAGAKGTGKWTTQIAGDLGIGAGAIYSALEARQISNKKDERERINKVVKIRRSKIPYSRSKIIKLAKDALLASVIISYIQGFLILREASSEKTYTAVFREKIGSKRYTKKELNRELNLSNIASIWKAGCIIRSNLLGIFEKLFKSNNGKNLLLDSTINKYLKNYYSNWKESIVSALELDIPYQATCSAFNYFNSFRSENLPLNLTQAQRDLFGAHTFQKYGDKYTYHHYWGLKYSLTRDYKFLK